MMIQAVLLVAMTSPVPPIEVTGCKTGVEVSDMLLKTDGNYEIDFINEDRRTVDVVAFKVYLGSSSTPIRDSGIFSSGILVSHRFWNRGGEAILAANPRLTCDVQWVHFTDGSEWRA